MTLTAERATAAEAAAVAGEVAVVSSPPAAPAPAPAAAPAKAGGGAAQAVALTFTIALVALAGFGVFLFALSGLAESRHQNTLYKTFSYQLGQALAPVGPTAAGKPVALLTIPRLGLHNVVVVEGTTSKDMTAGPGHLRQSPLPGQPGTSVIFGKRSTSGAPFAHLLSLQVGDIITTTTGQGTARYRVSSFGTTADPAPANSADRVVFVTANGVLHPSADVQVSADLIGVPKPAPGGLPIMSPAELAMHGDGAETLVPLLLWSQALLVVALGGTVAFYRWSRHAAIFCLVPLTLAVTWQVYANLAGLLPNLF